MVNKVVKIILSALFIIVFSDTIRSQVGSFGLTDARQLGLGNTYVINSRELYAAGKNPAMLADRNSARRLNILFPNLSLRGYNVSKVSNYFNDFFSKKPTEIIGSIDGSIIKQAFENGGRLFLGLQIGYLGVGFSHSDRIGSFSFAMKDYLTGFIQLPKALVNFNNKGMGYTHAVYFKDFHFQGSWTRAYELSYGKMFRPDPSTGILSVYAGIGTKFMSGFMYREINFSGGAGYQEEGNVFVGTYHAESKSAFSDDIDIENAFNGEQVVSNVPFMQSVGKGLALDLGLTVLLDPGVKVGVSFTDLGFIDWKGKTRSVLVSGVIRIDSSLSLDDIDSLAKIITIEKESDKSFRTYPSGAVHIGFGFMVDRFIRNFPGEMNVAVEFHQGIQETMQNPDYPRIAAGLDWKAGKWWPVLLTGLTTNRDNSIDWSLGLGYELSFLELYLTLPDFGALVQGAQLETLSVSMCWHFMKEKNDKGRQR